MKPQDLSDRLKVVVRYIPKGSRIADIGSDHAKLPCYAVENDIVSYAVAGEVNQGPLASAKKNIQSRGLEHVISPKLGNGLEVLEEEEIDVVTIAGMGGPLIMNILEQGKARLGGVKRLVLQPNVACDHIRKWLYENGWSLDDEQILEEDGHIYEVVLATKERPPESAYTPSQLEKEMWLGPYLMKRKDQAFNMKWTKEKEQLTNVLEQLSKGEHTPALVEKKEKIKRYLSWLEEELQ